MPLVIKVSVSRKLTQDFNSRGWSLDIQSELDPRTLDNTNQLADSTNYLFQLANDLLDQQVQQASLSEHHNGHKPTYPAANGNGRHSNSTPGQNRSASNGTYPRGGNGNGHADRHRNGNAAKGTQPRNERPITEAQINAINKMAQKFDTNGDVIATEDFNCKVSELTLRQASELIDRLKKGLEAQGEQGAAR